MSLLNISTHNKSYYNTCSSSKNNLDITVDKLTSKCRIVYHGTNKEFEKKIRDKGLDVKYRVNQGNTCQIPQVLKDNEVYRNCYVSTSPDEAAKYAKSFGKNGVILSMICNIKDLKKDHQSGTDTAFKIQRISRKFILPQPGKSLEDEQIKNIIKKLDENSIKVTPGEVKKFIRDNLKDTKSCLDKCTISAVQEVEKKHQDLQDLVVSKYSKYFREGEVITINQDDLDALDDF